MQRFCGHLQESNHLRQAMAWVETLKRPPAENAKILFNDVEGSKKRVPQGYDKTSP